MPFYVALVHVKVPRVPGRGILPPVAPFTALPKLPGARKAKKENPREMAVTAASLQREMEEWETDPEKVAQREELLKIAKQQKPPVVVQHVSDMAFARRPLNEIAQMVMDQLTVDGAVIRSVQYAGRRPLTSLIKGKGVTYYETDVITLDFLAKPQTPGNFVRRCKTLGDLLRVHVVRADEVLKQLSRPPSRAELRPPSHMWSYLAAGSHAASQAASSKP